MVDQRHTEELRSRYVSRRKLLRQVFTEAAVTYAKLRGRLYSRVIYRHFSAATYQRRVRPLRNRVREKGEQRCLFRLVGDQVEEHPELVTQTAADVEGQVRGQATGGSVKMIP